MTVFHFAARSDIDVEGTAGQQLVNCFAQSVPGESEEYPYFIHLCAGHYVVNGHDFKSLTVFNNRLYGVTSDGDVYQDAGSPAPVRVAQTGLRGSKWVSGATRRHLVVAPVGGIPVALDENHVVTQVDLDVGVSSIAILADSAIYAVDGSDRMWVSSPSDAVTIPDNNWATAQSRDDSILTAHIVGETMLFFGKDTIEQWYVNRDQSFPLAPYTNGISEQGICNRDTFARSPNVGFWVTDSLTVFAGVGRDAKQISTRALHEILQANEDAVRSSAFMFSYAVYGRWFVVLTIPGVATWEFDTVEGLWHNRKSPSRPDWEVRGAVRFEGGTFLWGDAGVYRLTSDSPLEKGESVPVRIASGYVSSAESRLDVMDSIVLRFDGVRKTEPITLMLESDHRVHVRADQVIEPDTLFVSRRLGAGRRFRLVIEMRPLSNWVFKSAFAKFRRGSRVTDKARDEYATAQAPATAGTAGSE